MGNQFDLSKSVWRGTRLSVVILVLCFVAFSRGIIGLDEQSLWWDESLSHYRAAQPFGVILTNRMQFLSGHEQVPIPPDNHPPLYFVLLRCVTLLAGDSEFALRYLSLAAGALAVPLLYLCGTRLFGDTAGLFAAALGALSPLYLWAQQEARPYALGTALTIASFYALLRAVQACALPLPANARSLARWTRYLAWPAVYLLLTAALLLTHYQALLLLPAHLLGVLLARCRDKRILIYAVLAVTLIAVGVGIWGLQSMPIGKEIPSYAFVPLRTLLEDVLRSFPLGLMGPELPAFQWLALALLIGALCVLAYRARSEWQSLLWLVLGFALPIVEIYAISFVRPAYMTIRHLVFASPFYYLLLAGGLALVRRQIVRIPLWLTGVFLAIGMIWAAQLYRTEYIKEDHRAWGRYLSQHVRANDLVLINSAAISDLYFYYVESQADWFGYPPLHTSKETSLATLETLARQYERVWVAQSRTPAWANPGDLALTWLSQHATRFDFKSFASRTSTVTAHAFRTRAPLVQAVPNDAEPLDLDFGGKLRLLGIRGASDDIVSGHVLQLSLFWTLSEPLSVPYRLAISLVDDQGYVWASRDTAPSGGTYPTTEWPARRIVRDDIDLDVPPGVPPGSYRINLTVYPEDHSGPALAVSDAASGQLQGLIVPVAQVQVIRPDRPPDADELPDLRGCRSRFGALGLLGHSTRDTALAPGDILLLDAYWRARRSSPQDPNLTLQIRDQAGKLRVEQPISPAGAYSTDRWSRGEVVRGQYRLRIPLDLPPGEYDISIAAEQPGLRWPWESRAVVLNHLTVREPLKERTFQAPPIAHAVGAVFGERIELLGFDLDAPAIRPGNVVSCTLYWRALAPVNQNYTVFNHLIAPDGQMWGQWDNQPARGAWPTTRWSPGQVIADPYQIPVSANAPLGTLALRVGMYDHLTMIRLPARAASGEPIGDHITLTEIEVIRP